MKQEDYTRYRKALVEIADRLMFENTPYTLSMIEHDKSVFVCVDKNAETAFSAGIHFTTTQEDSEKQIAWFEYNVNKELEKLKHND